MGSQLDYAKQQRACIVSGIDEEEQEIRHNIERNKLGQNADGTGGTGTHPEGGIEMAELLCDLDYIKAEYERAAMLAEPSEEGFRISLRIDGAETCTFKVGISSGAHFAAELDVLAALIRARTLKAQLNGQALSS